MHKLVFYHPFDKNSLDERARLERNKKVSDPNPHTKPRLCRHFWKRLLNALPHANWVCCMYKDFSFVLMCRDLLFIRFEHAASVRLVLSPIGECSAHML